MKSFPLMPMLALFAAVPALAHAQASGRTVTAEGAGLPSVRVEVWGRGVVLHVTSSDGTGAFKIPPLRDPIARYAFRYLGHETVIVQPEDFRDGSTIVLSEEPIYAVEGVTATVSRETCPRPDQAEARSRWSAAAAGYNQATSARGLGGSSAGEMKDVSPRRLFQDLEDWRPQRASRWNAWIGAQRFEEGRLLTVEELVQARGYAWSRDLHRPEYFLGRDRHLHWIYPELDTRSANHFATEMFGRLHTFSIAQDDEQGLRIRFCPKDSGGGKPSLEGTILMDRQNKMVEAEWRFVTRDPEEDAGGWVRFGTAPDPLHGLPHLVATRGVFYRRLGSVDLYPDHPRWVFRDRRVWDRWVISPDREEPLRRTVVEGRGSGSP